jgi:protein-S-isoprenylcysteine O-methyltransferase Ste14
LQARRTIRGDARNRDIDNLFVILTTILSYASTGAAIVEPNMNLSAKPDSPGVNLHPPLVFVLCLAGGVAAEFAWRPPFLLLSRDIALYAGVAVALLGFLFQGFGWFTFKRCGAETRTNCPAPAIVTSGAFRLSRNPMYVGFVAMLAGAGIAANSVPLLLAALAMFLYLDWYVIAREERYLSRAFGAEYEAYCRKVRRWL